MGRKRRRNQAGMLITLRPLFGTEKDDRKSFYGGRTVRGTIAYHNNICCVLDEPCVRFRAPKGKGYLGVTARNVIIVLKHEEIHHVLARIDEWEASICFDNIVRNLPDTCPILNCSNHQIGAP